MRLNPPKKVTFWISVILAALGFVLYLLSAFGVIGFPWLGFALLVVAFVLLALGLVIKGL